MCFGAESFRQEQASRPVTRQDQLTTVTGFRNIVSHLVQTGKVNSAAYYTAITELKQAEKRLDALS